ncbi:MAG: hypothetical protein GY839_04750 [candidate division Zixibacteria bacterium]|nr:hypothetical protein [candidate division Zixibacteria bacterium]
MIYKSALHPFISIGEHDHGFLQDLNKDSKRELKVNIASGGSNGAEDVYIYSIDSAVVLINALDGMNKVMPRFRDIDRDSIPEIIFNDNLFLCWHTGCAGSPRPPLIWRWDGERYRLANFKYKDHILNGHNNDPVELRKRISSYVETYSFRKGYDPYPPALWKAMLQQIYAGNSNVADSIFNNFWPPELSDKNEFYLEFINHLHNGPYWEELQQSDW